MHHDNPIVEKEVAGLADDADAKKPWKYSSPHAAIRELSLYFGESNYCYSLLVWTLWEIIIADHSTSMSVNPHFFLTFFSTQP
jgi:hypothetical protein